MMTMDMALAVWFAGCLLLLILALLLDNVGIPKWGWRVYFAALVLWLAPLFSRAWFFLVLS